MNAQTKLQQVFLMPETEYAFDECLELQNERGLANDTEELHATLLVLAGQMFVMNKHLSSIARSLAKGVAE